MHLEINNNLQEWIVEEWTNDFNIKPTGQNLQTIGDFITYAKDYYSQICGTFKKDFVFENKLKL